MQQEDLIVGNIKRDVLDQQKPQVQLIQEQNNMQPKEQNQSDKTNIFDIYEKQNNAVNNNEQLQDEQKKNVSFTNEQKLKQNPQRVVYQNQAENIDPEKWNQIDMNEMYIIKQDSLKKSFDTIVQKLKRERSFHQNKKRPNPFTQEQLDDISTNYADFKKQFVSVKEQFQKFSKQKLYSQKKGDQIKSRIQKVSDEIKIEQHGNLRDIEICKFFMWEIIQRKNQQMNNNNNVNNTNQAGINNHNLQGLPAASTNAPTNQYTTRRTAQQTDINNQIQNLQQHDPNQEIQNQDKIQQI